MLIKILVILFVIYAVSRAVLRYRREEISSREVLMWTVFWLLVLGATLWPKLTDLVASFVGVGRGADLLIFISIVALFFIAFRLIVKLEKIERDITRVVRHVALDEKKPDDHA